MTSDEYITNQIQAGARVLKLYRYDPSQMNNYFNPLRLFLGIKHDGGPANAKFWNNAFCRQLPQFLSYAGPFVGTGAVCWSLLKDLTRNYR
jgi:hypothetical protein